MHANHHIGEEPGYVFAFKHLLILKKYVYNLNDYCQQALEAIEGLRLILGTEFLLDPLVRVIACCVVDSFREVLDVAEIQRGLCIILH